MAGLEAKYDRVPPIKDGACGSAAPIRLQGFESSDGSQVTFSPGPTMSCVLAKELRLWLDTAVQPAAEARLHTKIAKMSTLSSYDCRMRYNNPALKISEHALANAIDIGEFVTAKGDRISVLDNWYAGDARADFLHDIHTGACQMFGTTLGPEANSAHKNHFHLDMKERRHPICDFTPEQARARTAAHTTPTP